MKVIMMLLGLTVIGFCCSGGDVCALLKRGDINFSVDHNMTCQLLTGNEPGFGAWYKPANLRRSFTRQAIEKSAVLELQLDGKKVDFTLVPGSRYWQPDKTGNEFKWHNVVLRQDVTLHNDLVACKMRLTGLSGKKGQLLLTLKSMGQGTGQVEDGLIRFDIKADVHKGYTQWFGTNIPNAKVTFADHKVKPYPDGYASKTKIDTESRATVSVPLTGQDNTMDITIVTGVSKAPQTTRDEVAAAVKAPDALFAASSREWKDFFTNDVPNLESSDKRLMQFYYWCYYVFKANTFMNPDGSKYYICPSKYNDWLPFWWDEDTAHIVTGARWFNSPEQLKMLENMILHFCNKGQINFGLTTMAGWELYMRTGDVDFLRKMYPAIKRNQQRYLDKMAGDMVVQHDSYLVGWDDSIRYAWGGFNKNLHKFERPILPVDLNSYLVREYQILANMAEILGDNANVPVFRKKAEKLTEEINRLMWDEKSGFYYDIFQDDNAKLYCKAASGFTPMLADIPSAGQAKKILQHLKNPKEFNTKYALPTIAVDMPGRRSHWSGDVCGRNNWLVEMGLDNYDKQSAAWITHKTIDLFMREEGARASAYQKPDYLVDRVALFSTGISGGLDMQVKHIIGFTPEKNGFSVLPAALDPKTKYLRWQVKFLGKDVDIRWDRPDGKDYFGDGVEGYDVLVDGKTVYHSAKLPEKRHAVNF